MPRQDFGNWGYFEGERVWLGPQNTQPAEPVIITTGNLPAMNESVVLKFSKPVIKEDQRQDS